MVEQQIKKYNRGCPHPLISKAHQTWRALGSSQSLIENKNEP